MVLICLVCAACKSVSVVVALELEAAEGEQRAEGKLVELTNCCNALSKMHSAQNLAAETAQFLFNRPVYMIAVWAFFQG